VKGVADLGMEVCCTLGMLTEEQAKKLKDAGLYAYNHNLDTAPEYYEEVITTRQYQDRLNTLREVRDAGINVCCGGIVGMGETRETRAGLIAQLANLNPYPESVPINHLVQVKGTPLYGTEELDPLEFDDFVREKMKLLDMKPDFLDRSVNEGFSGGEKKRNEILQMALLEPKLSILDETDSGLDIDALKIVANGVNQLTNKNNATILVTHYQRLLDYIVPDYVHVMQAGRIVMTGGKELALELETRGYDWISTNKHSIAGEVA